MAHFIPAQYSTPADALRSLLDTLERLAVKPTSDSVEELLVTLDKAEAELDLLEENGVDVRSERVRWENLLRRIDSRPQLIASAAHGLPGGMDALRARHAPADSFWWNADKERANRQRRQLTRTLVGLIAVAVVAVGAYWLFVRLFPPDPVAVAYVQASADIERFVDAGDWQAALGSAENAIRDNKDPDLVLFAAAVAEKAGEEARAEELREEARTLLSNNPLLYWIGLGNRRLRVYNAEGAEEAAQEALALAPDDAEVALLLGRVALENGDRATALSEFDRAYTLAVDTQPQLAVSARVLYADLLRQIELPSTDMETETDTDTDTDTGTGMDVEANTDTPSPTATTAP